MLDLALHTLRPAPTNANMMCVQLLQALQASLADQHNIRSSHRRRSHRMSHLKPTLCPLLCLAQLCPHTNLSACTVVPVSSSHGPSISRMADTAMLGTQLSELLLQASPASQAAPSASAQHGKTPLRGSQG